MSEPRKSDQKLSCSNTCLRLMSSRSRASRSSVLGSLSLFTLETATLSCASFSRTSFFKASISLVSLEIVESCNGEMIHMQQGNIDKRQPCFRILIRLPWISTFFFKSDLSSSTNNLKQTWKEVWLNLIYEVKFYIVLKRCWILVRLAFFYHQIRLSVFFSKIWWNPWVVFL